MSSDFRTVTTHLNYLSRSYSLKQSLSNANTLSSQSTSKSGWIRMCAVFTPTSQPSYSSQSGHSRNRHWKCKSTFAAHCRTKRCRCWLPASMWFLKWYWWEHFHFGQPVQPLKGLHSWRYAQHELCWLHDPGLLQGDPDASCRSRMQPCQFFSSSVVPRGVDKIAFRQNDHISVNISVRVHDRFLFLWDNWKP